MGGGRLWYIGVAVGGYELTSFCPSVFVARIPFLFVLRFILCLFSKMMFANRYNHILRTQKQGSSRPSRPGSSPSDTGAAAASGRLLSQLEASGQLLSQLDLPLLRQLAPLARLASSQLLGAATKPSQARFYICNTLHQPKSRNLVLSARCENMLFDRQAVLQRICKKKLMTTISQRNSERQFGICRLRWCCCSNSRIKTKSALILQHRY